MKKNKRLLTLNISSLAKKSILLSAVLISFYSHSEQFILNWKVDGLKGNNIFGDKEVIDIKEGEEVIIVEEIPEEVILDNRTCLSLLQQNSSLSNGYYALIPGEYYCDMYSGGYTLIKDINTSNTESLAEFTKKSNFADQTNYPTKSGDDLGFWVSFTGSSNGSFNKRDVISNSEGFEWDHLKISFTPLDFGSTDYYLNYHASPYNRDSLNGQFVDGFAILTESELVGAFTKGDNAERREVLGIPDNKSFIGLDNYSIEFNQAMSKEKITLRGMLDQWYKDEDIGFSKYQVWIK